MRTRVPVTSLAQAAEAATHAITTCGDDADNHLRVDLREERLILTVQTLDRAVVTLRDVSLARRLTAKKIAEEAGVDDLHAVATARQAELQLPKNVHFNPNGSKALAEKVVESITAQLPK